VTDEVGCERVHAENEVVKSKNFDNGNDYNVTGVEWVDGFELHADFELKRTRSCARRVL
jgi:hypothetical protein